jgi:hypothetical protein
MEVHVKGWRAWGREEGTVSKSGSAYVHPVVLRIRFHSLLQIERKRGITIKAQTASMIHVPSDNSEPWLINLIDTPGMRALPSHSRHAISGSLNILAHA